MDPISPLLLLPRPRPSLPLRLAPPPPRASAGVARTRLRRRRLSTTTTTVSAVAAETAPADSPSPSPSDEERFDWLDQWYPIAPVCDLDPRAPHGKTVLGLRIVAWFDRTVSGDAAAGDGEWRVFDDACPHRLAPLSEGRVDDKGRLQCVYHGWCFDGRGACQFIPQAPALGPPVHKNSKACVASYPCVVQNNILWFYPRSEPEYSDVLQRKRPPYIPQIDDPSFVTVYGVRDLYYGYDVLVENLMDPAHVPYAHKGLMRIRKKEDPGRYNIDLLSTVEFDKEGGGPIKMQIEDANVDGFMSVQERGYFKFVAPCTFYGSPLRTEAEADEGKKKKQPTVMLVFLCIPVSPGRSRLVWAFPRNVGVWMDKIIPRWYYHIGQNAILDSDIYLLHIEERNFVAAGLDNWQKACYVPTSSDNMIITFRNWFRKYCKHQIGWAAPIANQLPATPTKDQLMERYWSHVMQCTSCSAALKRMRALEVALQVASVAVVGFLAVAKGTVVTSVVQRAAVVAVAVLCFAASRWLANFIEKNFYFQDYVHAYKPISTARLVPWRRQWIGCTDAKELSMSVSAVAAKTPLPWADEEAPVGGERFDWLDQWYPIAPICDLDKRAPHGKMVMGLKIVTWFDGGEWRVLDDMCPHRLAPLSEGRVDNKGRLQCAYHGWCFDGRGSCQFIPQAPALGPHVHKNNKACVASYPCVVQNNILWFYPRSEPEFKDVLLRKRPPYIPEIDNPSSVIDYGVRDLLYGYELLVENFMDPAHVPYAHRGLFPHEGGVPIKMNIEEANIDGFHSNLKESWGYFKFVAPITLIGSPFRAEPVDNNNNNDNSSNKKQPEPVAVFFCVPVAPGKCRVIWANGHFLDGWFDRFIPRWWRHTKGNQVLDSDSSVLHIEERNYAAVGLDNWHKACYVPTSSDNLIIAFRNWFKKYGNNQVGWLAPTANQLPPASTRVEVFERYWSHVMQCTSCRAALKGLRALEVALQVASVAIVGFLAAAKGNTVVTSTARRATIVAVAVLFFAASRWLTNYIEKAFYFQDFVLAEQ
uniref:Rieske domain-containing protein n=1 Tax=Leersia perrieri TaxID=77586 RepID=A0A0D9W0C7_9ORYZ